MTPGKVLALFALRVGLATLIAIGGLSVLTRLFADLWKAPTWDGAMALVSFGGLVVLLTLVGVVGIMTVR